MSGCGIRRKRIFCGCCPDPSSMAPFLNMIEGTYVEILGLAAGNDLIPGVNYKITDRGDGNTTNGAGIILMATSTNELSAEGQFIAMNPDFTNSGTYTNPALTGTNLGVWWDGLTPTAGDVVIWFNSHYVNLTGIVGTDPDGDAINWAILPKEIENGYIRRIDFCICNFLTGSSIVRYRFDPELENGIYLANMNMEQFQWGNPVVIGITNSNQNAFICANSRAATIESCKAERSGQITIGNDFTGELYECSFEYCTLTLTGGGYLEGNVFNNLQGTIDTNLITENNTGQFITPGLSNSFIVTVDLATAYSAGVLTVPLKEIAGIYKLTNGAGTEVITAISGSTILIRPTKFICESGLAVQFDPTAHAAVADNQIVSDNVSAVTITGRTLAGNETSDEYVIVREGDVYKKVSQLVLV